MKTNSPMTAAVVAVLFLQPLSGVTSPDAAARVETIAADTALVSVLEKLQSASLGQVLSIATLRTGPPQRYRIVTSQRGQLHVQTVELAAGQAHVVADSANDETRPLSVDFAQELQKKPLALAELVRRANAVARGMMAIEAEYEVEHGRLLAEVEFVSGEHVIELAIDPFTGAVIELEIEDDDDSDDDDSDDDHDDHEIDDHR